MIFSLSSFFIGFGSCLVLTIAFFYVLKWLAMKSLSGAFKNILPVDIRDLQAEAKQNDE